MKNELEWRFFSVSQLSLNLITPRGSPVIQNLQNLNRVCLLIIARRKKFFIHLNGLQQLDCKYFIS